MNNENPSQTPRPRTSMARYSIRSGATRSVILPTNDEDFVEHYVVIPPDGGWGWVVVGIAFICNFLIDGTTYTFGIFLNDISESFKVHPTKVAIISSLMSGFYYIVGPLACALSNRFGFRFVGIIGGVMSAVTFAISSYLTEFIPFLVIIGVFGGIGFNMVYTPCMLIVGFYFERWRALATAISVTGTSIGIMAFPQIFDKLFKDFHWRTKFKILSGTCLLLAVLVIAFKPIKPTKVVEEKKGSFYNRNAIEEDESIGSFYMDEEAEPFSLRRIFQRLHNALFPTVFDYSSDVASRRTTDERSAMFEMIPDSASDDSFARSCFKSQRESVGARSVGTYVLQAGINNNDKATCCGRCCGRICQDKNVNRPLYRDDIFYGGSVYNLPEYMKAKSKLTVGSGLSTGMGYLMSVSRVVTQKDLEESRQCVCCPEAFARVLVTMMDVRLFKSKAFLLLTLSGFLTMVGLYVPFVFIVQRGMELELSPNWCTMLLTIMGVTNTVGRVLCGIISFFPRMDALVVSWVTLIIGGLITISSAFMNNLVGQIIFTVIFGICVASFTTLRTVVITNMLGLENLTNAFGITIMFYGIASFLGIPLAGYLQNVTGKYAYSFMFSGSAILLSGVVLIPAGWISKWEADKKKPKVQFRV